MNGLNPAPNALSFNGVSMPSQSSPVPSGSQPSLEQMQHELNRLQGQLANYKRSIDLYVKAEKDWDQNRKLFKLMTSSVSDLIAIVDRHGHRTWNNPAYFDILGFTPEELSNTYSLAEVHPDDQAKMMAAFDEVIGGADGRRLEYRMQHKTGKWIWLEAQFTAIQNGTNEVAGMIIVARDISGRREADAQHVKAKQIESIGSLANGVAKEFNEINSHVMGQLSMAKTLCGVSNHALLVRLREIERFMKRGVEATQRLMSIATTSDENRQKTRIDSLVNEVARATLDGTGLTTTTDYPDNLAKVKVDAEQLREALAAILTNARQATSQGSIRIKARNFEFDPNSDNGSLRLATGPYVHLTISDQGGGMTQESVAHAFEPYFTTKNGAKGLGLTTALSIVQQQGGTITLDSAPSMGTKVHIFLPAVDVLSESQKLPVGRKPRVLLMDDEPMILEIVKNLLEHVGYEVTTTKDGAQAIAAYSKANSQGYPFDLVLLDLVVPDGVGGQDAVHTLTRINSSARVIAASGHADHPVMDNPTQFGFCTVIHKPYTMEKVQAALDEAFAQKAPSMTMALPRPKIVEIPSSLRRD